MTVQVRRDVLLAAKLFRGFGDPTRLAILEALAEDGELRVADLIERVGGSQGNVSGHLACLKDCGLVRDRPEGRQVFYRISDPVVVRTLRASEDVLAISGEKISLCPNYRDSADRHRGAAAATRQRVKQARIK
ncbi:MAG: ArsR/SmtB family transcription factor [Acidimicrobiia bacterium]